jgi:hypothetical protein
VSAPLGYLSLREASRRYGVSRYVIIRAPSVLIEVDGRPRRYYDEVQVALLAIEHHARLDAFKRGCGASDV